MILLLGNVGNHKEKLSSEQSKQLDQWIENNFKSEEYAQIYDILKEHNK